MENLPFNIRRNNFKGDLGPGDHFIGTYASVGTETSIQRLSSCVFLRREDGSKKPFRNLQEASDFLAAN